MLSSLREKLNRKIEYFGNKTGFLGDILTTPVSKAGLLGLVGGATLALSGCAGLDTNYIQNPGAMNRIKTDLAQTKLALRAWEKGTDAGDNAKRLPIKLAEIVDAAASIATLEPFAGRYVYKEMHDGIYNHKNPEKFNFSREDFAEKVNENFEINLGKRLIWHVPHTLFRVASRIGNFVSTFYNALPAPAVAWAGDKLRPKTSEDAKIFALGTKPNPGNDKLKKAVDNATFLREWIEYGVYVIGERSGLIGDAFWYADENLSRWAGLNGNDLKLGQLESKFIDEHYIVDSQRVQLNILPPEIDNILFGTVYRENMTRLSFTNPDKRRIEVPLTTNYFLILNSETGPKLNDYANWLKMPNVRRAPGEMIEANLINGEKNVEKIRLLYPTESNILSIGKLATSALLSWIRYDGGGGSSANPVSGAVEDSGRTGGAN